MLKEANLGNPLMNDVLYAIKVLKMFTNFYRYIKDTLRDFI